MQRSSGLALQNVSPAKPAGRRRGATAVEMAIVSPIVFTLFLGIIEVARALMVIHLLNNAALAGCRTGIIEGQSTSAIQSEVNSVLATTGISGDSVTVQVNDGSADASTAVAGDEITVKVSVPFSSVSWLPAASFVSGSLQGQYTMRRE
jgi:Flp pilus assembly protein TadG